MMKWTAVLFMLALGCRFDLPSVAPIDANSRIDTDSPIDAAPDLLELVSLAGDIGSRGNLDGTSDAARFYAPIGVAVDSAGNLYVADLFNYTIRKVTASGVVTTLAGTAGAAGSLDGTGVTARFREPKGVAVDSAGNVYVADSGNHTIRKVTTAGIVTTLAGTAGMQGNTDGTGAAARFRYPSGVAVDRVGNVYVSDSSTIRKITAAGIVTTLAGSNMQGSEDGTGAAASFRNPSSVAVDDANNIYVADLLNYTIRKVTAAGVVTTLAGTAGAQGDVDGMGAAARFSYPFGVAVDNAGNIYVADMGNQTIRKVTAAGVVTTLAGTAPIRGSTEGTGAAARFNDPIGVAVDSAGNVYVADWNNNSIRKVTAARAVTTLAGRAYVRGSTDGAGAVARFSIPVGVAVDGAGNAYVADMSNHTIRKVTAAGVVTTLAGTAGMRGSSDGTGAAARFNGPASVAVDRVGNIYVAEKGSDSFEPGAGNATIRKITAAGVVTTLAGAAGMYGSLDGTGTEARFWDPRGVAVDSAGNVYVADMGNATIRKVTAAGVVTTLAGTAGMLGSTDGTGASARFNRPSGVAVDSAGNVYVAESGSYCSDPGNSIIRKVTPAGVVTTLAGVASMYGSTDGPGATARFNCPTGVAIDDAGNVYIADQKNSVIRKVTAVGTTTTIAGMAGMIGILPGTSPRFAFPTSLAITGDSIVISDSAAILLLRHGAR